MRKISKRAQHSLRTAAAARRRDRLREARAPEIAMPERSLRDSLSGWLRRALGRIDAQTL